MLTGKLYWLLQFDSEETKSPAKGYKVAVCDSQLIFKLSQSTFYFLRSVVEDTEETT